MGYASQLKSTLNCVETSKARREAEINMATIAVVNNRAALKAARKAEESALRAIKTAERAVVKLKSERKDAYALSSQSEVAMKLGEATDELHNKVMALRKDQAEVLGLETKARELGQVQAFQEASWNVSKDLRVNAEKLDATWQEWHSTVNQGAKKALKENNWYRRMAEARKVLDDARKEHLKYKGDVMAAIERRNNAINRLNKLMEKEVR